MPGAPGSDEDETLDGEAERGYWAAFFERLCAADKATLDGLAELDRADREAGHTE